MIESEKEELANPTSQDEFYAAKQALIDKDNAMHFSSGIKLSDKGIVVDNKMKALRDKMFKKDKSLNIGNYYRWRDTLINSELYDILYHMPKPAIHHAHLTACATIEFLVSLTMYDSVYYSEQDNLFYCSAKGCTKDGYIKVNTLR